jgi:hypothetical protein
MVDLESLAIAGPHLPGSNEKIGALLDFEPINQGAPITFFIRALIRYFSSELLRNRNDVVAKRAFTQK